ncbi:hypothetical protein ACEXQE_05620 [Herbiconiux sp. P17]|uniref:hypothetical protein n=1 Tax=Herbiconiux wuyangfengii TaxID=3342794 RepID=UPI0035BB12DD
MDVLVAQIIVTTISVTAGALLALLIDRGKGRRVERIAEVNALRLLTIEIGSRRALSPEQSAAPLSIDRADPDSDLNRVMRSVVLLRKEIRTARKSLRPRSTAWNPLNYMVAACNIFIENVDERPSSIVSELEILRIDLDALLIELCATNPKELVYRPAGSTAYRRPSELQS